MGLKHCMGHIYTKKIYHCFIWNSDLSEHLVFLATKSGHIRASCIFSYEPRRLQWNAGWVCDVSRRHSPTWLPVGLRSHELGSSLLWELLDVTHPRGCPWASGSHELGSSLLWELLVFGQTTQSSPYGCLQNIVLLPQHEIQERVQTEATAHFYPNLERDSPFFLPYSICWKKSVNPVHIQERGLPKALSKKQRSMEISRKLPTVVVFPKNEIF